MIEQRRIKGRFSIGWLKKNFESFLISTIYCLLMIRFTLLHNTTLNTVTASMIDSGSLLDAYSRMSKFPINLNQNEFFHTSFYGGTYNLLNVIALSFIRLFTGQNSDLFIPQFAFTSRLLSLVISTLFLFYFHRLLFKVNIHKFVRFMIILFLISLPSFVKFSYEIHPEPLAMLFGILTLICFVNFVIHNEFRQVYFCLIFGVMATFCKQTFAIYLIFPLIAIFILFKWSDWVAPNTKPNKSTYLKLFLAALFSAFLSNAYAFLNPGQYLAKLKENIEFTAKVTVSISQSRDSYLQLLMRDNKFLLFVLIISTFVIAYLSSKRITSGEDILMLATAIAILAGIAVLVFFIRFYFISSYLLPLYPLALLLVGLLLKINLEKIQKKTKLTLFLVSVGVIASCIPNFLVSFGSLSRDLILKNTVQFNSDYRELQTTQPIVKVLYSPTIPIIISPEIQFENTFAFDPNKSDFEEKISQWNPSLLVLDDDCAYCENKKYTSTFENLGYRKISTNTGISSNSLTCSIWTGFSQTCVDQIKLLFNWQGNVAKFASSSVYFYQKFP